jgi:DNA-binding CsgD family transcriptional regulator
MPTEEGVAALVCVRSGIEAGFTFWSSVSEACDAHREFGDCGKGCTRSHLVVWRDGRGRLRVAIAGEKRPLGQSQRGQQRVAGVAVAAPQEVPAATELLAMLSPRQRQVVDLLVAGKSTSEIADIVGVRSTTVYSRIHGACEKGRVSGRDQLVALLLRKEATT